MRAMLGDGLDDPIRIGGQRPEDAGAALVLLWRWALGAVGFAPFHHSPGGEQLPSKHRSLSRLFPWLRSINGCSVEANSVLSTRLTRQATGPLMPVWVVGSELCHLERE
jgi:hypothetical protein